MGTFKRIGRVYQQTFVDTYSKVSQAKVYTKKTALTAADILNDRVLPWYEAQGISVLRILTDRGMVKHPCKLSWMQSMWRLEKRI